MVCSMRPALQVAEETQLVSAVKARECRVSPQHVVVWCFINARFCLGGNLALAGKVFTEEDGPDSAAVCSLFFQSQLPFVFLQEMFLSSACRAVEEFLSDLNSVGQRICSKSK